MSIIHWTQAVTSMSIAPSRKIDIDIPINKEDLLKEIKSTHLEIMDACDINIYAREIGVTPNEVRRMMIQPDSEDENENFFAVIHSFDNDESDSLINYF